MRTDRLGALVLMVDENARWGCVILRPHSQVYKASRWITH